MGNEAQEATDEAKQGLAEVGRSAENASEKVITLFRAFNSEHGFVGDKGITWLTDSIDNVITYLNSSLTNKDAVGMLKIDPSQIVSIDANGSTYEEIKYLGDGTDDLSKKMIDLDNRITELRSNWHSLSQEQIEELNDLENQFDVISDDTSNLYGIHNTDWIMDTAKNLGYVALQIKNVDDSFTGTTGELTTTFALLDRSLDKTFNDVYEKVVEYETLVEKLNQRVFNSRDIYGSTSDLANKMKAFNSGDMSNYPKGDQIAMQRLFNERWVQDELLPKYDPNSSTYWDDLAKEYQVHHKEVIEQIKVNIRNIASELGSEQNAITKYEKDTFLNLVHSMLPDGDEAGKYIKKYLDRVGENFTASEAFEKIREELKESNPIAVVAEYMQKNNIPNRNEYSQYFVDLATKAKKADEVIQLISQHEQELSNQTPPDVASATPSTEAETKALLSKKEVVEQLRAELNLTKKAAEDLFNEQGYSKTNGKYQIEQQAVDELIASLKEKQKVEEQADITPSADESADAALNEAKNLDEVFESATKAAEAKGLFAEENGEVLESIIKSLSALNAEGNGFENLNKIIKNLSNNKDDRITDMIANLDLLREVLSKPVNPDSFINALRDLSKQGDALKNMAVVLSESVKKIEAAKKTVDNSSSKKTDDSSDNNAKIVDNAVKLYKELYDAKTKLVKIKDGTNVEKARNYAEIINETTNKINELTLTEEQNAEVVKRTSKEKIDFENAVIESKRKASEQREKDVKAAEKEQVLATKQATGMMRNGKLMAEWGDKVKDLLVKIKAIDTSVNPKEAIEQLRKLRNELTSISSAAEEANKSGKTLGQMFAQRFKSLIAYLGTFVQFYDLIRYTRQAFETIKDLDTQLVDLRKTTIMTTSELNEFYYASSDVAKGLGVTTSEIISQAAAWSRLGYSTKEAATEMAEMSSKFASISPGMTTDQSTDYLVSTMQAYGIAVDDVERKILDNVNRIGNTFATTNAEIGEMLTRSSAAMKAANNSLEETIALESAAVEITRMKLCA